MSNWTKYDSTFRYMMLSRMRLDCDYYLGNGGRNASNLWAGDERKHIANMQAIWNTFSAVDKPEWLSYEDISEYAKQMGVLDDKTITIHNGKYRGVVISEYGIENGELDYRSLGRIIEDYIPNDTIRNVVDGEWDLVAGKDDETGGDMIMHEYIISEQGYEFLKEYTTELVFYNSEVDVYIWAVTHTNTSWDYVLTGTKIVERG